MNKGAWGSTSRKNPQAETKPWVFGVYFPHSRPSLLCRVSRSLTIVPFCLKAEWLGGMSINLEGERLNIHWLAFDRIFMGAPAAIHLKGLKLSLHDDNPRPFVPQRPTPIFVPREFSPHRGLRELTVLVGKRCGETVHVETVKCFASSSNFASHHTPS